MRMASGLANFLSFPWQDRQRVLLRSDLIIWNWPGIPWGIKRSIWSTPPSRMALAADLQSPLIIHFSRVDDLSLYSWAFDMFGSRTMTFFTSCVEFHIF